MSEIVGHPEYILEVIPDIELMHEHIKSVSRDNFSSRIHSLLELIDRVETIEKNQIKKAVETKFASQILGSLERGGLLQRRLLSAADRLLRSAFRSERERVREAAEALDPQFTNVRRRTEEAEKVLAQLMISGNLLDLRSRKPSEIFRQTWGDKNSVELRAPQVFSPADPNVIEIECEIAGGREAEFLFVRVDDSSGRVDSMTDLRRVPGTDSFVGEVSVSWSNTADKLPELRLSLFADARPLLRPTLSVHSRQGGLGSVEEVG